MCNSFIYIVATVHTGKLPHKWVRFWKTANPTKLEKIREKKQAPLFIVFTTYRKHRRTDNTNHVRNKTEIPAGYPLVYYCFKHSTPSFISQLRERRQKILKKTRLNVAQAKNNLFNKNRISPHSPICKAGQVQSNPVFAPKRYFFGLNVGDWTCPALQFYQRQLQKWRPAAIEPKKRASRCCRQKD